MLGSPALRGAETKAPGPPGSSLIIITHQCWLRLGGQGAPGSPAGGTRRCVRGRWGAVLRFGVARRGPPGPEARPRWRSAAVTDSGCSGDRHAPRSRPASLRLLAGKRAPLEGRGTRGDPGAGQPSEWRGGALLVTALRSSAPLFSELPCFGNLESGSSQLPTEV